MISKEWRYFLIALGFFTRIPVPNFPDFTDAELNHATKYFPLTGILVGVFGALVFMVSAQFLTHAIAVLISMVSTIYITGAFHEDGLADSADGIGGGWQREQILTIMQDSRLGTYGAVALCLVLFTKFQLLNALDSYLVPYALIAAHAMSRLAAVWVMVVLNYVKPEGKAKPLSTKVNLTSLIVASLFGWLPYILMVVALVAHHYALSVIVMFILITLFPMVFSWIWWHKKIKYWIGGYTGDTLGAMQQIAELAFYFGLVLWSVNH